RVIESMRRACCRLLISRWITFRIDAGKYGCKYRILITGTAITIRENFAVGLNFYVQVRTTVASVTVHRAQRNPFAACHAAVGKGGTHLVKCYIVMRHILRPLCKRGHRGTREAHPDGRTLTCDQHVKTVEMKLAAAWSQLYAS